MSRGRLIFPITAEIARLDLASTAADPDGAGPLTSGFDEDYREAVNLPSIDRLGTSARREVLVTVPAQAEPDSFDRLQMFATGDSSGGEFVLVLHFQDLEDLGLVDPVTGQAVIKVGDRLKALYRPTGELIQSFPDPPGLFVRDATPIGIGFDGNRNLLKVTFHSRDQGGSA
jgi:hypothetical protein